MNATKLRVELVIAAMVLFVMVSFAPSAYGSERVNSTVFPKTSFVELGTATWCEYCPGADGALNKLANQMSLNELAIVEYHSQDSYSSTDSLCSDRLNFYSIPGTPMAFFSGENGALGGSANPDNTDVYNWYKSKINNDLQNETGVVIGLNTDLNDNTLNISVIVTCGETPADSNLYLEVMLVNDQNKTVSTSSGVYYLRYSALKWIGDTPVNLSAGDVLVKHYSTTLDSSWNVSKLYVTAAVQTRSTHPVFSGSYHWNEAKVYNSAIQPVKKWELVPQVSEMNTYVGQTSVLNTTVHNELSVTRTIAVGSDPSTVPAGWTVQICIGGVCYDTPEVNVTLQPGETENVYYHITSSSGGSQTGYIKIYAQGNQWYSDVHYIKVNSIGGVPELNFAVVPVLIAVGSIVLFRRKVAP